MRCPRPRSPAAARGRSRSACRADRATAMTTATMVSRAPSDTSAGQRLRPGGTDAGPVDREAGNRLAGDERDREQGDSERASRSGPDWRRAARRPRRRGIATDCRSWTAQRGRSAAAIPARASGTASTITAMITTRPLPNETSAAAKPSWRRPPRSPLIFACTATAMPPITAAAMPIGFRKAAGHGAVSGFPSKSTTE